MRGSVANLHMTLGLALALAAGAAGARTASAQMAPWPSATQAIAPGPAPAGPPPPAASSVCDGFVPLRNEAQQKGNAIGSAQKRHAERKELCTLVSSFATSEGKVVKFLENHVAACGIPQDAVAAAKTNHEKTLKFREVICAPAPQPHTQTLSDAIGTPSLDTAKNTRTGHGTFDTLTGNPLAR